MNEEDLLDDEEYFNDDPFYYKLNETGRVTEIVIAEIEGEHDIRILPEEIMSLDALEELHIRCRDLRVVPTSVREKFSVLPQYNDFKKSLDSEQPSKIPPVSMVGKAEEEAPFQLDYIGTKQYVLDCFLKHDKEAQDYAKDVWSIMENPQLTEKEKINLVRKRLAKFEEELDRKKLR